MKINIRYLIRAGIVFALNILLTFILVIPLVNRLFPSEADRLARNTIMMVAIFAMMASIKWVLSKLNIPFIERDKSDV